MARITKLRKLNYPMENGKAVIEIHTDKLGKIFDEKDPSPLLLKDLDDSFVDYIYSSAEEIGTQKLGKIKIYFYKSNKNTSTNVVQSAISNYFEYQVSKTKRKIYNQLVTGFKSLAIGLICMGISLGSIYFIKKMEPTFWNQFISEGLLLFCWVSLWKPFNTFLYEWWPSLDEVKIYQFLTSVPVDVIQLEENVLQISSKSKTSSSNG